MRKKERQRLIKQLLTSNNIQRQEDFVSLLDKQGIKVTQATVSRDIKDMQLVKVPSVTGGYRYSLPTQKNIDTEKKLVQSIRDSFVSVDSQDKLVFMKVLPGSGPVISSLMYQMNYSGIFGTLGDDNTVLIIGKTEADAINMRNQINSMLGTE
ncbi:arginine repressor [Lentilactobacillus buchneri]|uniref:Arginine repressor n=1 Tax=Lentilactobacillus buchneri subsp. silagei CD034 TaxID=1071400 RepID=J9W7Z6_LENBU|nr:ArgR family transcriptional regulator [Lentilactobacillus buchneri]MCC6100222.1 ArgR family transcriptional regulator [Lactobacillus sp.]AEB73401.1 arginine repressor, ArgR [Lentilactobacillus buchneri NRRL B-30929]AFS00316.1 Arginine repressor [Lentilactobacillus buchneri subsp. silagei CD034]MCT2881753.1 ArgR family transcriptional regulator [Lentilactobacillus buchneri]MCT2899495.1 ArgR family transcriptional regulator [Lentilactobacillus buchneri]